MRQFAWYSPELNSIVLQTIIDECRIAFEWGHSDMIRAMTINGKFDNEIDPLTQGLWIPLGEL